MKRIIKSTKEPDKNVLWLHQGVLKEFENGSWRNISSSSSFNVVTEDEYNSLEDKDKKNKFFLIKQK